MAPLTGAAGLLPLGRHEPAHEHSDRGDHHAAEGHERQLPDPAEISKKLGELLKNAAGKLQLGRDGLLARPGKVAFVTLTKVYKLVDEIIAKQTRGTQRTGPGRTRCARSTPGTRCATPRWGPSASSRRTAGGSPRPSRRR